MGPDNPYPGGSYGMPPQPQPGSSVNGLAIASLVLGIAWICGIGSIAAVVLGHVSLGQIKRTGATGRGLAIAGLVLGYLGVAGGLITAIIFIAAAGNDASALSSMSSMSGLFGG